MPHEEKFSFTTTVDGKTYECERIVTTARGVMTQFIHVLGVGSRVDDRSYVDLGPYDPTTMHIHAALIADEIIRVLPDGRPR